MAVTIEELNEKMFKPIFINGRGLDGEITYESSKDYMALLVQDAKDKMKELYPDVKYKIAVLEQKSTQQYFVVCTFLLDGQLFYLFQNFSWNENATKEFLTVNKVTQIGNT